MTLYSESNSFSGVITSRRQDSRLFWNSTVRHAGRLVAESRTGVSGYDNTFSYDAAANRLEKTSSGNRTTYTYDIANQLKTSTDSSGTTNYVFDADGNQSVTQSPAGQRTTNSWGYENELTAVLTHGGTADFIFITPTVCGSNAIPNSPLSSLDNEAEKCKRVIFGTTSPILA